MAGIILETMSTRRLLLFTFAALILEIAFFLIGGLIAPKPHQVQNIIASVCPANRSLDWIMIDGHDESRRACNSGPLFDLTDPSKMYKEIDNVDVLQHGLVYVIQYPLYGERMSKWFQWMVGVMDIRLQLKSEQSSTTSPDWAHFGIKMGGTNDPKLNHIELIGESFESRSLTSCEREDDETLSCSVIPLFDMITTDHSFYLINIRVPVNKTRGWNVGLPLIQELDLAIIHPSGGFTLIWLCLKTILFPIILMTLFWSWRRIRVLARPTSLMEKMLISLGIVMSVLNFPIDWIAVYFSFRLFPLLSDIRQGLFYSFLLVFWMVFSAEHLMDNVRRNSIAAYWRQLLTIGVASTSMFLFEMCERGVQLSSPFFSIWSSDSGARVATAFLVLAAISAAVYLLLLLGYIVKVFRNISAKRCILPQLSESRRSYYLNLMYRFKFLMCATVVCAALTVLFFVLGNLSESKWQWEESINIEYGSAFMTGVYGMWNIYVFALLVLYTPSKSNNSANGGAWSSDTQPIIVEASGEDVIPLANVNSEISAILRKETTKLT